MLITILFSVSCAFCYLEGEDVGLFEKKYSFGSFVVPFIMLALSLFVTLANSEREYKQGQIDALTNKIKYELVTNADSTKTWKEIKE
jgi:hypothetical protein